MTVQSHADPRAILCEGAASLGFCLDERQVDRLLALGERILAKNREINLTGARDLPTLLRDHILDSLTLVLLIQEREKSASFHESKVQNLESKIARSLLVDVGSGGGVPALPIAVVLEDFDFLCIESAAKKTRVLEELCETIGLNRVTILGDRVERVGHDPQWRERADWATARGVGSLATTCELTLPLLRTGGRFLAQKGADVQRELADAQSALIQIGGRAGEIIDVGPERRTTRRMVVIIEKIAPTPDRFPRRAGLPAKRPLKGCSR